MNRNTELKRGTGLKQGCGKRRYRDELAAKMALARIAARDDTARPKAEQRAYWHARCDGWHLTSMAGQGTKPPRGTGPSKAVRLATYERDGWCCVCCGKPIKDRPHSVGHRKRRSQGGTLSLTNLLTFLGTGRDPGNPDDHHALIDSRIDREDEAKGYTVRSWQDPAAISVMVFSEDGSGASVYLTEAGGYSTEPPERAA